MIKLRSLPLCVTLCFPLCILLSAILFPAVSQGQGVAPAARIVSRIDEAQLVTLTGNTNPRANAKNDRGAVSANFALPDLTLVLSRSAEQQAAFDAYVASEYDQNSPNYHQWLTPQQIGAQFGPAQADIATITGWLASHGFAVKLVTPDRMTIRFSGTAGQVQNAFHTQIHNLSVNGVGHYANMSDPQIPAALSPVVIGVKALHNFLPQPQHKLGSLVQFDQQTGKWKKVTTAANSPLTLAAASSAPPSTGPRPAFKSLPQFGTNGDQGTNNAYLEEDVTPYDFATIYNVLPLWNNNITGSGQTIAIAGTSFINIGLNGGANDVATFRGAFGLSTNFPTSPTPHEIDAGSYFNTGTTASICTSTSSTAYCGLGDLLENSLDVEWSGAVAPNAQIDLVVTGQSSACNATTGSGCIDTLYDSAAYVVDNLTAKILSVSYGECELGQGTAGNVAFYNLWQQAAAEGIAVFVATGDSGSPACDDEMDSQDGNPYLAQYGLSVSGLASTPYNTAVGGTDFSWCQPYVIVTGTGNNATLNLEGCASSSTSQGSPAYWNTSNNGTTGASALGYVPEIPWNDTCMNPINARFLETYLSASGFDSYYGVATPTTPEETCSQIYGPVYGGYPGWYLFYEGTGNMLAGYVDTVGGSGGASNCVVNNGSTVSSCTGTSVSTNVGTVTLTNDGWPKPVWQSGITGIPSDGVRDIPDVSFFAGNGNFNSATLICVSNVASCTYLSSTSNSTQDGEVEAQEVGGTSVATPQMAGVMALINQKAGAAQGNPDPELYDLAGRQTYSSCSAESVTTSSSCYFQDIDNGPTAPSGPSYTTAQTNAMPCDLNNSGEGGAFYTSSGWRIVNGGFPAYSGTTSPNCAAINSGDTLGTLVTSGTTAAYNSGTGFDLATGLGSLNVSNVVNAWPSGTPAPNFSLVASGVSITQGATTGNTSTITVEPADGFTGTVNFTCSVTGTPSSPTSPVTCGTIASATVSGSAEATTTLAVGSTGTTTAGQYTLKITGTSGSITQSTTINVTVTANPTFALSNGGNISVAPGATSGNTSLITITPGSGGFSGTVNLACSFTTNASTDPASCSLSSYSVTLSGTTAQTSTLTIGTTAYSADLIRPNFGKGKGWLGAGSGAVLALLVFFGIPARRRSWRAMLSILVTMVALGALASCGGGGSSGGGGGGGGNSNPGTTAGTYTVTITGASTSPSYSSNTTVTLTVQ
jgi:subtilase family serine protease